MRLPARAAAVRGDDFQYAFGWYLACKVMADPDLESISVEDPFGGSFDDVVVRRRAGVNEFFQVKTSVRPSASTVVDEIWLTTARADAGRSPLQHFYGTFVAQTSLDHRFQLTFVTNRGYDHAHELLALRDSNTEVIDVDTVRSARPRSRVGVRRDAWLAHLGVSEDDLLAFLAVVCWRQAGAESHWAEIAAPLMRLAGLRDDPEAVWIGLSIVRQWVKDGVGPRSREDLRNEVRERNLLAGSSVLHLAVHAIDRSASSDIPHVTVDVIDQFIGDSPFARRRRPTPLPSPDPILSRLSDAATTLEGYSSRILQVQGAVRTPLLFALGRTFPRVRGWELRIDQTGAIWSSSVTPEAVQAGVLDPIVIGHGDDLAVAVSLTTDPTVEVEEFLRSATTVPVGSLIVVRPADREPGQTAVSSAAWLNGWVHSARGELSRRARGAPRVHLFLAAPAAAALFLGHNWNLMPPTEVYDYDGSTYHPGIITP